MCPCVPLLEVFLGTLKILFSHILYAGVDTVGSNPKEGTGTRRLVRLQLKAEVVNEGSIPSVV